MTLLAMPIRSPIVILNEALSVILNKALPVILSEAKNLKAITDSSVALLLQNDKQPVIQSKSKWLDSS
ncbi:hypothetical protein AGMMS50229_19300 [Campylobacterota bacterium]|nr:hypothetical protein AGMMS50229_19300 [Campylobacterota bacterium]